MSSPIIKPFYLDDEGRLFFSSILISHNERKSSQTLSAVDLQKSATGSIDTAGILSGVQKPCMSYANTAKYLGMTLGAKLRWNEHFKEKRDELNIKFRKMYWLLGRNS
jgi:hypothetical protein